MQKVIKVFCQNPKSGFQSVVGCGFIIDNYFLTAGHVVKSPQYNYYAEISNVHIPLENPIINSTNQNCPDLLDLAVFEINNDSSSLSLFASDPQRNMVLNGICFSNGYTETPYEMQIINTKGKYFEGDTSIQTCQGSSGSPIFFQNDVIGMMVAGNCEDGKQRDSRFDIKHCRFLSSKAILDELNKLTM